jgi:hypothetical protein
MFLKEDELINSLYNEFKNRKNKAKTEKENFFLDGIEYVIEEIKYTDRFKRYENEQKILNSQIFNLERIVEKLNIYNQELVKKMEEKESLLYLKQKYKKLQEIAENENEHDVFWAYEEVLDEINNLL